MEFKYSKDIINVLGKAGRELMEKINVLELAIPVMDTLKINTSTPLPPSPFNATITGSLQVRVRQGAVKDTVLIAGTINITMTTTGATVPDTILITPAQFAYLPDAPITLGTTATGPNHNIEYSKANGIKMKSVGIAGPTSYTVTLDHQYDIPHKD